MRNFVFTLFTSAAVLLQAGNNENSKSITVWTGVYTEVQADRGKAAYDANCISCHAGPPSSEVFMRDWSGSNLSGIFDQIKATMPADAPSSLSDRTYVDLVAFILRTDAFPSGTAELAQSLLKTIRVEPKDGSQQVPTFALVSVVGCLMQDADKVWRLTNATEPVRTKDPEPSRAEELKNSQAIELGTQKFRLIDIYPAPDEYKGYKVETKGFLIRDPQENRLNVTSLQSLAPKCEAR